MLRRALCYTENQKIHVHFIARGERTEISMAERIEIHSRNDTFQLLEAAMRNRNKRHRQGFFVVESVKGINLALQTPGWEARGVV